MCLGIPGRIIERHDDRGLPMGVVDFGGVRRSCCLAYVADDAHVGDYVIVHVGFAISKVQEDEARRTYEALREMSQLDELDWMRETADLALLGLQSGNWGNWGQTPISGVTATIPRQSAEKLESDPNFPNFPAGGSA